MSDRKRPAAKAGAASRRSSKRKASTKNDADDSSPLLIPISQQSTEELASVMLSWLPNGATIAHADAKKLLKSFDHVRAELQHRSNLLASKAIETGEQRDVLLSDVSVPSTVMLNVLEFLPRYEAVHSASLVSKSWLAVARAPQFWTTLNHGAGLLEKSSTVTNMTDLLTFLKKPHFSSLKTLVPPHKVQTRKKAFEDIALSCPLLENIDAGYHPFSLMKIDDATMVKVPEIFPHLNSFRFNMYRVTDSGVKNFCLRMGERLVDLGI